MAGSARHPFTVACALALALVVAPPAAFADGVSPSARDQARPAAVRFVYERAANAADCPGRDAVLDAVRGRLGFDPFNDEAPLTVRASLSREGQDLRSIIRLSSGRAVLGERLLVSPRADCTELASAMALAVSIAIDPLTLARTSPSPPTPVAPPAIVVAQRPTPPAQSATPFMPRSTAPDPKTLQATLGVAGNVGRGLSPTAGLLAGFGVRATSWSIVLEGRADLPSSRQVGGGGGTISVSTLAAALAPCLHKGPFGGCVLAEMGLLRGSGSNLDNARRDTTPLVALGGRASWELPPRGAFGFRAHLDVLSPLTRTTLNVGGTAVWTSPPLSLAVGFSAVARFW